MNALFSVKYRFDVKQNWHKKKKIIHIKLGWKKNLIFPQPTGKSCSYAKGPLNQKKMFPCDSEDER